jgi:voltage-gated potassium channel
VATPERRRQRLEQYERYADVPLLILAVGFVPLVAAQIFDADLSEDAGRAVTIGYVAIWAIFVVDYVVRFALAPDRKRFFRGHIIDLFILAFPFLRPFILIRLGATFGKVGLQVRQIFTRHHLLPAIGAAVGIMFTGSILVLVVERDRGAIDSLGEALWWGVQTITTVGYGDLVPVTPAGRIIGAMVMVSGVAVFGVVAANLAAFLTDVQRRDIAAREDVEETAEERLEHKVDHLLVRLERLEQRLEGRSQSGR